MLRRFLMAGAGTFGAAQGHSGDNELAKKFLNKPIDDAAIPAAHSSASISAAAAEVAGARVRTLEHGQLCKGMKREFRCDAAGFMEDANNTLGDNGGKRKVLVLLLYCILLSSLCLGSIIVFLIFVVDCRGPL